MRVISKKTIKEFYEQSIYKESKDSLESWYREVINATWENPNEIKEVRKDIARIKTAMTLASSEA